VALVVVVFLALYIWSGFTPADVWYYVTNPGRTVSGDCTANLQRMSVALTAYLESTDQYPPAECWMDELIRFNAHKMAPEEAWKGFRCPVVAADHPNEYGYAMNEALSGALRPLQSVPEEWERAKRTPVIFDSSDTSRNARGRAELLPKPGRHGGKNHALFADGHVAEVTASDFEGSPD
jgi:prepilin-type processing-associated H-X9-DG protein